MIFFGGGHVKLQGCMSFHQNKHVEPKGGFESLHTIEGIPPKKSIKIESDSL